MGEGGEGRGGGRLRRALLLRGGVSGFGGRGEVKGWEMNERLGNWQIIKSHSSPAHPQHGNKTHEENRNTSLSG